MDEGFGFSVPFLALLNGTGAPFSHNHDEMPCLPPAEVYAIRRIYVQSFLISTLSRMVVKITNLFTR